MNTIVSWITERMNTCSSNTAFPMSNGLKYYIPHTFRDQWRSMEKIHLVIGLYNVINTELNGVKTIGCYTMAFNLIRSRGCNYFN